MMVIQAQNTHTSMCGSMTEPRLKDTAIPFCAVESFMINSIVFQCK